jgi:hypothetical protein
VSVTKSRREGHYRRGCAASQAGCARALNRLKVRKPKLPNKASLLPSKVNGHRQMQGGLSTGPKTLEGRRRIAESNRTRATNKPSGGKRGKGKTVTQRGNIP